MATQGLQNTRMQYLESVHDAQNARETEYEEVHPGVPSDVIKFFIPSVAAQFSVLTADASCIPIPTDERTDLAQVYSSGSSPAPYVDPTLTSGGHCELGGDCCMGHVCPHGLEFPLLKQEKYEYIRPKSLYFPSHRYEGFH